MFSCTANKTFTGFAQYLIRCNTHVTVDNRKIIEKKDNKKIIEKKQTSFPTHCNKTKMDEQVVTEEGV